MTLLYPAFLIALVAIAIPIAVHLFNFHRYRNVYFSNVRYLEELRQEIRRQRTLRQWLVLTARILAIVFLVLAFCQPVVLRQRQRVQRGGAAVSIYIDNSFSMSNTGSEGRPLLEQAVQKAKEIAAAYKNSDQFQLMTNEMGGSQFHWLSRDELLAQLDGLQTASASPLLSDVTKRQQDFLLRSAAQEKEAYIISDFQHSTSDFAALAHDSLLHSILVPLEASAVNNIYIDSLALSAPVFLQGNTVIVQVFLRNEGDSPVKNVPVRLFIGDQQSALATADLDSDGSAIVSMHFTINGGGALQGRVETTDYPVTFDDTMFFAINVRERLSVLAINGGGDNVYLQRLFGNDSAIVYSSVSDRTIPFSTLEDYSFIILNGLHDIPSGLSQTLHTFVTNGGTLLVAPAEEADLSSYNQMLSLFSAARLGIWTKGRQKTASINTRQPLYNNVFDGNKNPDEDEAQMQMELPAVQGYYQQQSDGTTVKESIITLLDGNDYLSFTPCGNGRLYLFSTPLEDQWTDFVQQALFVPTLFNMALYSGCLGVPYSMSDSRVPIPLAQQYDAERVPHLVSKDGQVDLIPDIRRIGGKSYMMPHEGLATAGCYYLRHPQDTTSHEAVAFNYSRQESAMQFCSRSEVEKALKDYHLAGYGVVHNTNRPLDAEIRAMRDGLPMWRWCIVAALFMLLVEIIILRVRK